MKITFEIPGKPFAKQRPRMTRTGRTYTPRQTVNAEAVFRMVAMQHIDGPVDGPVSIEVVAVFRPPKSWSKRKVAEHLHRPHCQRPDADNILKLVLDGLNGVAFHDDKQVFDMRARKVWGDVEKTIVTIERRADLS